MKENNGHKSSFDKQLPNLSGHHITRDTLATFKNIVKYLCEINISKKVREAEALRRHLKVGGGGLFWWLVQAGQAQKPNKIMDALYPYHVKKRILIPLDFNLVPYLAEMEKAVENSAVEPANWNYKALYKKCR